MSRRDSGIPEECNAGNHEEEMRAYAGIDPGASGAVAVAFEDGSVIAWKIPETVDDLSDLLADIQISLSPELVLVEKQGARPSYAINETADGQKQFTPLQGSASAWTFAQHYGEIRGILATLKMKREYVSPHDWQKLLGIPPRKKKPVKETNTVWKNRLKQKSQELFPNAKITLQLADAILIAEACRRFHGSHKNI